MTPSAPSIASADMIHDSSDTFPSKDTANYYNDQSVSKAAAHNQEFMQGENLQGISAFFFDCFISIFPPIFFVFLLILLLAAFFKSSFAFTDLFSGSITPFMAGLVTGIVDDSSTLEEVIFCEHIFI